MKTKVILLLIIVFMFNGMRDARELDNLSILSAVGVDIDEKGEYIITSQVLNTQKSGDSSSGSDSSSSVVVYETKRKSIHEALRDTIEKVPNKLYIAHLELVLISEEAAKNNDILDTLDFFLRDNEGGNNFMIVIAKDDKPQEILSKLSAITSDPSKAITESIESTYEYEAASTDYLLYDTLDMVLNEKRSVVVASVSLDKHEDDSKNKEESEKDSNQENNENILGNSSQNTSGSTSSKESEKEASSNSFKVTELAYFKDRKFEGYLEKSDAKVYNLLQNRLKSSVMSIDEGDDLFVIEIKEAKSSLKPKFENDNFVIDINVKIQGTITETGNNIRDNINEKFDEYIQKLEDIMKGKIEDAIDNYQHKYKEDIVGFEDLIYKKLNSEYKKVEDGFEEKYLDKIVTNVNVEVELPQQGGDMVDATS